MLYLGPDCMPHGLGTAWRVGRGAAAAARARAMQLQSRAPRDRRVVVLAPASRADCTKLTFASRVRDQLSAPAMVDTLESHLIQELFGASARALGTAVLGGVMAVLLLHL